jgi:transposase-like protein
MANRIPDSIRNEVRALWLRGGITDEALARRFQIRPGTLRSWKHKDDWERLRDELHGIVDDEVRVRVLKERTELNRKHDHLAEALEGMIVALMRKRAPDGSPAADASAVRAMASALAATQKIRRVATGIDRLPETPEAFGPTRIMFHPVHPDLFRAQGGDPQSARASA